VIAGDAINTRQLMLRPMDQSFVSTAWVGWLRDPEVVAFSRQRHREHTLESCAAYAASYEGTPSCLWAITLTGDGRHVGNIAADIDEHDGVANVAVMIGERECWGRGLASEAVRAVCDWLFDRRGLRKVEIGTMEANRAMVRVARKVGMVEDGRRREQVVRRGQPVDLVYFALFRGERGLR
jgi:RimJ/RimL family protein N-acetyltransferase